MSGGLICTAGGAKAWVPNDLSYCNAQGVKGGRLFNKREYSRGLGVIRGIPTELPHAGVNSTFFRLGRVHIILPIMLSLGLVPGQEPLAIWLPVSEIETVPIP
jgi:hypothetical protein